MYQFSVFTIILPKLARDSLIPPHNQQINESCTRYAKVIVNKEKNTQLIDMSVKSVRLKEIMDYINPKVAFIKVDAEGKDCMVRSIIMSMTDLKNLQIWAFNCISIPLMSNK